MSTALSPPSQLLADLKAVRELISVPERWTQREHAREASGMPTDWESPSAVCWCYEGARYKVCGWGTSRANAMLVLGVRQGMTVEFNDTHTHAEVLAKLDELIAQLEGAH